MGEWKGRKKEEEKGEQTQKYLLAQCHNDQSGGVWNWESGP